MAKAKMPGKPVEEIRQTVVRVEPAVMHKLNLFCSTHPLRPRRDSVIEVALVEYMEREEVRLESVRAKRAAVLLVPVASP